MALSQTCCKGSRRTPIFRMSRVAGRSGDIARLLLSAFLGITLGDTAWLQALQLLGATRT